MVLSKGSVKVDWDSLLESILANSTGGNMLPDAGRFEYFLRHKGSLTVTPGLVERFGPEILIVSYLKLNGEQIGKFTKFYSDGQLSMLQYRGIIPGYHNGINVDGSREVTLQHYTRRNYGTNGNHNGVPFP